MKKILILTVTAGEGHNSMAKSLKTELAKNPENDVKVIDLFKRYGKFYKNFFINDMYIFACKHAVSGYNFVCKQLLKANPEKRNQSPAQGTCFYETAKLLQDIYFFEPDVIFCVHFYPAIMLTNLRKKYFIPAKIINYVFDFTLCPFLESTIGVDYLISPNSSLHPALIEKGFKAEQLLDYGIPTRPEFSEVVSKKEARRQLDLDEKMFTVLVMSGGGGFGKNPKWVKDLLKVKKPMQIIVVNGKDKKSKKAIEVILKQKKKNIHTVKNYGFIDFVGTVMSAADIFVGKFGGNSVSEALNKKLPIVGKLKMAFQERDNLVFLTERGAAITLDKEHKLVPTIEDLIQNKEKITKMISKIEKLRKPNAALDVANLVQSFEKVDYNNPKEITPKDYKRIYKEIKEILKEKPNKVKQRKKVVALKKQKKSKVLIG